MRGHKIIFFIVACLVVFGIFALTKLNKDEFPQFTIRQGVVAAVYPGATAQEVEEQVTKPLERFLFTYAEIDKEKTYSVTENGIVYVYAELRVSVKDKDGAWSKIRHGLQLFKKTSLPAGVLEIVVVDDFGNTSSMLLTVESPERTPRELEHYAEQLCDRLRSIPEMGNIKILGQQNEEIAVLVDQEKLASYGISQRALLVELATQGIRTMGGNVENEAGDAQVHVSIPYQSEYEIGEQIIFTDPLGHQVRLRDIADIQRRYAEAKSHIKYNGASTVLISMEMAPGNNIVAFGKKVESEIAKCKQTLPPDVEMHKITNQPYVVNKSVMSFLRDLLFSILVVIAVMLLLFPLRTALVSGSSVPVCTAITMGLMYIFGIELNTVTLAALIVVLGMIVDDSVIVIDGYTDTLQKGYSRWYSAFNSTKTLFVPMSLATLAISGMFFPMTRIITGPLGDFVQLFPWTVLFALVCSIFYAVWIIPYLSTVFIKRNKDGIAPNRFEAAQNRFFVLLQNLYDKVLAHCFHHPAIVICLAVSAVSLGVFLFTRLQIQMLPKADRNCFAVEMHIAEGSTLEQTEAIADSMEHVLRADPRVTSVTSFIGCSSPRFHATYAPQMAHKNYAQFIVNTTSEKNTLKLIREYGPKYEYHFPNAYIRFKQIDYQPVNNPVEVRFAGNDFDAMKSAADSLKNFLNTMPELTWVHSDMDMTSQDIGITLKSDEATRLGVTQSMLSLYLSSALGGQNLTNVWEGDYKVPVMLYTRKSGDTLAYQDLEDFLIPTSNQPAQQHPHGDSGRGPQLRLQPTQGDGKNRQVRQRGAQAGDGRRRGDHLRRTHWRQQHGDPADRPQLHRGGAGAVHLPALPFRAVGHRVLDPFGQSDLRVRGVFRSLAFPSRLQHHGGVGCGQLDRHHRAQRHHHVRVRGESAEAAPVQCPGGRLRSGSPPYAPHLPHLRDHGLGRHADDRGAHRPLDAHGRCHLLRHHLLAAVGGDGAARDVLANLQVTMRR